LVGQTNFIRPAKLNDQNPMTETEHILKITDNRTGDSYNLPVEEGQEGTVDSKFFKDKLNLSCFDPGMQNCIIQQAISTLPYARVP
jgi:hypothetical protein